MKIGAFQFAVSNEIAHNMEIISKAVTQASRAGVQLLAFPECALTGYPPRDIEGPSSVQFDKVSLAYEALQKLSDNNAIHIIVGTIIQNSDKYYNSAIVFSPNQEKMVYQKRALWGWDWDNFHNGTHNGVVDIAGLKVGIRICFEIRFPEFFRELYKAHTDLNIILFYDVSDHNNTERYEMIKSHIKTRAAENVTYTLSVNTIGPYQTAPTALYDMSGYPLIELQQNEEGLLVYDLKNTQLNFGEQGRKQISDWLNSPDHNQHDH